MAPSPLPSSSQDSRHYTPISGQNHDRIDQLQHKGHHDYGPPLGEIEEDEDVSVSISQKMLSAVTGSVLTSLLVTPLDVVRVRLQSQGHSPTAATAPRGATLPTSPAFTNLPPNLGISSCCREVFWVNNNAPYCVAGAPNMTVISNTAVTSSTQACAAEEAQSKTFTSTLDGLRKIARNEGPRTLWRGLSPTLVMAIPANVIYFAAYDWLRYQPFRKMGMNDNYAPLAAGSTARTLAAIAVGPIEMFRTRMQASNATAGSAGHFRETMAGMREMIASNGLRSMWTGLTLTLWRDVPFSAIYWWGYEYGRNVLTDRRERNRGRGRIDGRNSDALELRTRSRSRENHMSTLVDSFIAGASSGAVAALITTPFDVGKTRQQVVQHAKEGASATAGKLPEEMIMPKFLWHIVKEQGVGGLFKGWGARCLKVAPACAIMISSYELGKKMAGSVNIKKGGHAVD